MLPALAPGVPPSPVPTKYAVEFELRVHEPNVRVEDVAVCGVAMIVDMPVLVKLASDSAALLPAVELATSANEERYIVRFALAARRVALPLAFVTTMREPANSWRSVVASVPVV